jgi:hypothetical protein
MFDLDALRTGALSKVDAMILRCREGRFTGDRGSKALAITQEEARTAAFRHLRDAFEFSADDFPSYAATYPRILATYVNGNLAEEIGLAVTREILQDMGDDILEAVIRQHGEINLGGTLTVLEARVVDTLDPIPQFRGHRLSDAIRACREKPGDKSITQLSHELSNQAVEMQMLIGRLDIADPPTADYAGRGRRFLLETSDLLRLVLQADRVDTFCADLTAEVRP